jgi:hypothetical protein
MCLDRGGSYPIACLAVALSMLHKSVDQSLFREIALKSAKTVALALVLVATTMYAEKYAPLPASVMSAKTVFIDNQTGHSEIADKAYEALSKWGRFTIVKDAKEADLVLRFTADTNGRPTPPGNNIDVSPTPILLSVRDKSNAELLNISKNKPFHSQTTLDIEDFKKRVDAQGK